MYPRGMFSGRGEGKNAAFAWLFLLAQAPGVMYEVHPVVRVTLL